MRTGIVLVLVLSQLITLQSFAANPAPAPAPVQEPDAKGEAVDVSKVTEKYWAQGKESELGVVQNRRYSNANRFEIDLNFGKFSTDPFWSVSQLGGSVGYYFSQNFSVHAVGWKLAASDSGAYKDFLARTTANLPRNRPKAFYGLQLNENFLYGKASLFGKAIIYVDIFALGGVGAVESESGTNVAPFLGIGQKIHLNKFLALDLDYRVMTFSEKVNGNSRTNTTDVVNFGLCVFI